MPGRGRRLDIEYRLVFAGVPPAGLIDQIEARFAPAGLRAIDGGMVIQTGEIDQAALRALLTLVWDVGAEVRSVTDVDDHGLTEHRPGRTTS